MDSTKGFFLNSLSVSFGLVLYSVFVYIIYTVAFKEKEEEKKKKDDTVEEKDELENFDILEEV